MKPKIIRLGAVISVLSVSVLATKAAQVVVVLRTGAESWKVVEAEKISINSKNKIRAGSGGSLDLQPGEYKKLQSLEILRAGILRKHAEGYMVRKDGGSWVPIAPDGAGVKAATSYAALWSSATIATQADRGSKGATEVKTDEVFAILPGSGRDEAVVDFVSDPGNFRGVGERDEKAAFDERMSLLVSAAGFVTGPPSAKLQALILSEMVTSDGRLSSGLAHYTDLDHGLQYVKVSEKAWPKDERQQKARTALIEKKQWLDQRIAILRAFDAGGLWDAFLDKYGYDRDFGLWDNSFDDLRKLHDNALSRSTKQHFSEGKKLFDEKKYGPALDELRWAERRSPKDADVISWIDKVSSRDEAGYKRQQALDLSDPDQKRIYRHVQAAIKYMSLEREKKEKERTWDDANSEIQLAAALDDKCYRVLFARALLLQAQGKLLDALKVLDQYAKVAPSEEVGLGEDLRADIAPQKTNQLKTLKDAIRKAEDEGDYPLARESAQSGVALDPDDLYFLLHAGIDNAILRNQETGKQRLQEYVRLSQTSGGDQKELEKVYGYLELMKIAPAEPEGSPNWYSGYKSPPGLFYCPVSLMPNPQIAEIKASRKSATLFKWNNGRLDSVVTRTQEPGESDVSVYFNYFNSAVIRVAAEPFTDKDDSTSLRFTAAGVKGSGKGDYVALLNNSTVDPLMLERLTGKRAAIIVAGNPYFHPFVWKGIYRFLAEYDDQGRVKSATLTGPSAEGPVVLEFKWQGLQLQEIAERGGQGYDRKMNYAGPRLESEIISFRGKTSKIAYKYKGDRLEAECGDDHSIDGRSRQVTFR
jgi:hypothetical protein